jgi:hypothetical protein
MQFQEVHVSLRGGALIYREIIREGATDLKSAFQPNTVVRRATQEKPCY